MPAVTNSFFFSFNYTTMLAPLLTLVTLFVSPVVVRASSCVAFDINWNLLAFGLDGKDWNAGTSDTWATGTSSPQPPSPI